ncbi:MAG: twin-arginine translocation signal domain-containing protein, partial [Actinobacteria bacterium]|nr:twin-arginine translocation signal domain-containing protein [Actinomycetota bacterium]
MNQTTMNQQMLPPTDLAPTKPASTGLTRRRFLRNSGIAVAAAGSASLLHTQLASAQGGATAAAA